jgi:hypothetical protein
MMSVARRVPLARGVKRTGGMRRLVGERGVARRTLEQDAAIYPLLVWAQQNAGACVLLALDKAFYYEALRDPDSQALLECVAQRKEADPFYTTDQARALVTERRRAAQQQPVEPAEDSTAALDRDPGWEF